jgi:hypothetical protein
MEVIELVFSCGETHLSATVLKLRSRPGEVNPEKRDGLRNFPGGSLRGDYWRAWWI